MVLAAPVMASNLPAIYQLMYLVSPEAAQFFVPVQKACKDNGIRMEVVTANIHDNTAEIYITLQDLTGDTLGDYDGIEHGWQSGYYHRSYPQILFLSENGRNLEPHLSETYGFGPSYRVSRDGKTWAGLILTAYRPIRSKLN